MPNTTISSSPATASQSAPRARPAALVHIPAAARWKRVKAILIPFLSLPFVAREEPAGQSPGPAVEAALRLVEASWPRALPPAILAA